MTKSVAKIVGYLFTPFFVLLFFGTLVVFQPMLVIALNIFGYRAHKLVLEWMNIAILYCLRFIGTSFYIENEYDLPVGRPLIIVSNHQSMYDIPLLLLTFRRNHPKFIAKKELGRWIPSISYALRTMGSLLIDRKDQKGSIEQIREFAKYIRENRYAVSIFPEGTRARDGELKKFKFGGLTTLIREIPEALIVPVVMDGGWKILRYNFWPVPFGTKVRLKVLEPFDAGSLPEKELCAKIEAVIQSELAKLRS